MFPGKSGSAFQTLCVWDRTCTKA